jgi:hypothetical protein
MTVLLALAGCSNREVYDSLQGARADRCRQVADGDARQRCYDDAYKSYEKYQRERGQ